MGAPGGGHDGGVHEVLGPASLVRKSGVVLRLGSLLLAAGAGSYRVKDSMRRAAHALGLHEHRAQVTLTEITTSSREGEHVRTEVTEQREVGVNAERIDAIAGVVNRLLPGIEVSDLHAMLDRIERTPHRYGPLLNPLAVALACAGFAFLNDGGPLVCVVVLIAAGLGQYARRHLQRMGLNKFAITALAAALSSSIYVGIMQGA